MARFLIVLALAVPAFGCAPRCHVRQVQWFDFENGITTSRTVAITVCDGGLQFRRK